MCFPVYGNALHRGSRPALYDSVKYGAKYWTEFQAWSPDDSSRTLLASEVLRSLASLGMEMSFHGDHEEREPFHAVRVGEDELGLNQAELIAPGEVDRAASPFMQEPRSCTSLWITAAAVGIVDGIVVDMTVGRKDYHISVVREVLARELAKKVSTIVAQRWRGVHCSCPLWQLQVDVAADTSVAVSGGCICDLLEAWARRRDALR
jgi:hypothetical protein